MCPEFEREEREFQKNVDKWEMVGTRSSQDSRQIGMLISLILARRQAPGTNRISPYRAVKAFHRPAAGNEQPVPSDVRPPEMLEVSPHFLIAGIEFSIE